MASSLLRGGPQVVADLYAIGRRQAEAPGNRRISVSCYLLRRAIAPPLVSSGEPLVPYQAVFYRDEDGKEPVNDFVAALDPRAQDSIDWMIGLLNGLTDENPELGHPDTSALKGGGDSAFGE